MQKPVQGPTDEIMVLLINL